MCYLYFAKDCLLTVSNSFMLPYLQYGKKFWGFSHTTKAYLYPLSVSQKYCIRLICHVNKFTHCAPLVLVLGLLILDDVYYYLLASFMFKVTNNIQWRFYRILKLGGPKWGQISTYILLGNGKDYKKRSSHIKI